MTTTRQPGMFSRQWRFRMRWASRVTTSWHGTHFRVEDDIGWTEYWRGYRHDFYIGPLWIGAALRKRARPLHELIHMAFGA